MLRTESLRRLLSFNVLLGVLAIGAGALSAWSVNGLIETQRVAAEQQAQGRHALREVIVLGRDVPGGQVLTAADLAVRSMPGSFLPPDARGPQDAGSVVGQMLAIPALRGDVLTPRSLRAPRSPPASHRLHAGDRAVTVAIDDANAVAGLVAAGDRIDLLYLPPDAGAGARVVPLLENVAVLSAGEGLDPAGTPETGTPGTLTLQVPADDAARIALAQRAGRLTILLRPRGDDSSMTAGVRGSAALLPRPVLPSTPVRGIEFIVGGGGQPLLARQAQSQALPVSTGVAR
jgi:pilus assembly protein CpaB